MCKETDPKLNDYAHVAELQYTAEGALGKEALSQLTLNKPVENIITTRRSALDYIDKPISLGQFVRIRMFFRWYFIV